MIYRVIIISMLLTSHISIDQTTVLEDTLYDGVGLVIENQSDILVRKNEFRNLGGVSPIAIQVINSHDVTIEANLITDITPHPLSDAYGIFIYNSHNISIINNNLTRIQAEEAPVYGIYIIDSFDITVSGNRISDLGNNTSFDIKVEDSELVRIDANNIEHLYDGNSISIHSTKRLRLARNSEVSSSFNLFHNISEFEFQLNRWSGPVKITDSINGIIGMDEYYYPNHTLSVEYSNRVRIENNDFIGVKSDFLNLQGNQDVYYLDNRVNQTISKDIRVELHPITSIDINTIEIIWEVSMIYNFSMMVEITNTSDGTLFTKTIQSLKLNASEITVSLDWKDIPWSEFNITINIIDYNNNTYLDTTSLSKVSQMVVTDNPEIESEENRWYIIPIIILVVALVIGIGKKTRIYRTKLSE